MKACRLPPSGSRVKFPLMPLYCTVANRLEEKTCESSTFHVFCGSVWSHVVSCGCSGPALRPNLILSLCIHQPFRAFEGMTCQFNFALRFSSVVLSDAPPAVIKLI